MGIYIMILQFIFGLFIIVGLHEMGHMIFAKLFGIRVEEYSIGFPPKIFKFKFKETEYSLGVIPLGGFVKISGMINEDLDNKLNLKKVMPWEFRSKPAWQRLLVILGGIIFNFITGFIIYTLITFYTGEVYIKNDEVNKHGIIPNFLGVKLGFKKGDKIIDINGKMFSEFSDIINPYIFLSSDKYYMISRDKKKIKINIPDNILANLSNSKNLVNFIEPLIPFYLKSIQNINNCKLKNKDIILEINGKSTKYFQNLKNIINFYSGEKVYIKYSRKNIEKYTFLEINKFGKLGIKPLFLLSYKNRKYNFFKSMKIGMSKVLNIISINFNVYYKIITGQILFSKSISSPIGIAKIFGNKFYFLHFWSIIALLSVALASINLLPIPTLDGAYALFIIYEIITGKSLSNKFLKFSQKIGLLIILILILYSFFNDLYKLF